MSDNPVRVVILGGGFAGVYTGMYLERLLRSRSDRRVELTIVSQENYLVFQPLLPDVISGAIETLHVVSPIRKLVRKARLFSRPVERIDLVNRTIQIAPDFQPRPILLPFDHLVVGLGTVLDCSKVPGMREHALSFKYLGDALRLRNHLVHVLEEADIETNPDERRKLLTFVVAGGGFSGVECIAEMQDFVRRACRAYQRIAPDDCRFLLLQSGERILPEIDASLAEFAQEILRRRGVEIALGTRLTGVTANRAIYQAKGASQPVEVLARTIVATVPAGPHPLLAELACPKERGKLKVGPELAVEGWPGIWAVGDCASVTQADGTISPPTAEHAVRQALVCARNIVHSLDGRPLDKFAFPGLGKLGSLGRGSAVAEVLGVKISGWPAWLMWRGVYLSKLPGWDRKIRVLFDWLLDLFLPRDITEVQIFRPDDVSREHFAAGEEVFSQGDFGDKLYFVAQGTLEVIRDGQVIATIGPGQQFGEMALVHNLPRGATVRAATPVDLVSVSKPAFEGLLAHLPGLREHMDQIIAGHLAAAQARKIALADTVPVGMPAARPDGAK